MGRAYWVVPGFSPQALFYMGMYAVVRKPPAYGGPRFVWQVILYLAVFACFYVFIVYSRELVHERPQEEEMDRMHAQVALHHRRGLLGDRPRQLFLSRYS